VRKALALLKGTYGLAVVSPRFPGLIVGARLGSPLVLGVGHGESFLASDPSALLGHTDKVIYLNDHQLCTLRPDGWEILDENSVPVEARIHQIGGDPGDAEKGPFEPYMLKESFEQPVTLETAMRGRRDGSGS